jgi:hypothetical protein
MNDSAIVVINTCADPLVINSESYFLAGIEDVSALDEVLRATIAIHRGTRLPWVPAHADEYKRRDFKAWQEKVVEAGLYRLDSDGRRYWPTWKCFFRVFLFQTRGGASFRLGGPREPAATYRLLRELGYRNLKALIRSRKNAFPVVASSGTAIGDQNADGESPPPKTSPLP